VPVYLPNSVSTAAMLGCSVKKPPIMNDQKAVPITHSSISPG
jgi:hypothetical protein